MKLQLASTAAIGLCALFLGACGTAPAAKAEATPAATKTEAAAPAKPALSEAAQQALAQAEADAKKAKSAFALWLPAEKALKDAQEAAKSGDSESVVKLSKKVSEMVALGLGQKSYPNTEMK